MIDRARRGRMTKETVGFTRTRPELDDEPLNRIPPAHPNGRSGSPRIERRNRESGRGRSRSRHRDPGKRRRIPAEIG